jgi:hypothetical protein
MNVTNAEKLDQIVDALAKVQLLLDGGYQYSSPVLRSPELSGNEAPNFLAVEPDGVSLVFAIASDFESVSLMLSELAGKAVALAIDTKMLCGVDLELMARIYEKLAIDLGTAAHAAKEVATSAGTTAAPKPERRKSTRIAKPSNQTSLLESSDSRVADAASSLSESSLAAD